MEAILLAGGLGTRLHEVSGDRYPKSLALVAGRPFIHYVIDYLVSQGVTRLIFAVSHHADMIIDDIAKNYPNLDVAFSKEEEPLGTGGAIKQALSYAENQHILVVNSDSFIEFSLAGFYDFHRNNHHQLSLVCTKVPDISRFGAADIDEDNRLTGFFEKGKQGTGYINAGVYLVDKELIQLKEQMAKFSFEHEILANSEIDAFAYKVAGLFFDIGTPDDFAGAQKLAEYHRHLLTLM